MIARYFRLLIAVLLAFAGRAHAARVLERYDVDSLSAMATLIVKAEVGEATDVHTRDGDCAVWDVTVLSALHGDAKPQSIIRVAGIEEYRKGPGIQGAEKTFPRLSKGDIVYLFLIAKDARGGYAKYSLTDADWKVIESGARLVIKDSVYGFGQYSPPAPSAGPVPGFVAMTDEAFPGAPVASVDAFEKQVAASLRYAAELRRKLSENALSENEKQTILRSRAAVLKRERARSDYIPWLIFDEPRQPTTRPVG
ncbi:MAG: hypothetical protein WBD40_10020 [Tepidisphaeraceae bacterium]